MQKRRIRWLCFKKIISENVFFIGNASQDQTNHAKVTCESRQSIRNAVITRFSRKNYFYFQKAQKKVKTANNKYEKWLHIDSECKNMIIKKTLQNYPVIHYPFIIHFLDNFWGLTISEKPSILFIWKIFHYIYNYKKLI